MTFDNFNKAYIVISHKNAGHTNTSCTCMNFKRNIDMFDFGCFFKGTFNTMIDMITCTSMYFEQDCSLFIHKQQKLQA